MLKSKICMTIAGSDPSGGAGIQADLKTFSVLKVYGCAAITCLTAQNSRGVVSYQPVSSDFIASQIGLVLEDMPVSHIKIGMVGSSSAAETIAAALSDFDGPIIFDPVLKASDGSPLLDKGTLPSLAKHLISRATVLTPNLPELEILTGMSSLNRATAIQTAAKLLNSYSNLKAVILKGGHFPQETGQLTDYILIRNKKAIDPIIEQVTHPRISTKNTHGTGCTFSSAFTAFHLLSGDYIQAFTQTVSFMDQLLLKSSGHDLGSGNGGLAHYLFLAEP